ncbi:MAG: hypothetical protein AAGG11_23490 [Pseudomonadota bacterium]
MADRQLPRTLLKIPAFLLGTAERSIAGARARPAALPGLLR